MARKPIIPVRADLVTKSRWQAAAVEQGIGSLAEFIRRAVEEKIERGREEPRNADDAARDALGVPRSTLHVSRRLKPLVLPEARAKELPPLGGKVFKGPDPKGGRK